MSQAFSCPGHRGELGAERVDLLDDGLEAEAQAVAPHAGLEAVRVVGDLAVAEARLLDLPERRQVEHRAVAHALHRRAEPRDAAHLREEPAVDARQLVDLVEADALLEGRLDGEESLVRRDS